MGGGFDIWEYDGFYEITNTMGSDDPEILAMAEQYGVFDYGATWGAARDGVLVAVNEGGFVWQFRLSLMPGAQVRLEGIVDARFARPQAFLVDRHGRPHRGVEAYSAVLTQGPYVPTSDMLLVGRVQHGVIYFDVRAQRVRKL